MDICLAIHNFDVQSSSFKLGQKNKENTGNSDTWYKHNNTSEYVQSFTTWDSKPFLIACWVEQASVDWVSVYNGNAIIAPAIRNGWQRVDETWFHDICHHCSHYHQAWGTKLQIVESAFCSWMLSYDEFAWLSISEHCFGRKINIVPNPF